MINALYNTVRWRAARSRAIARDNGRCTVSRLLGGACDGRLHVHHIEPAREGGALYDLDNLATVCAHHHPRWEALRRALLGQRGHQAPKPAVCRHTHRTAEARRLCEARLRRQRQSIAS